MRTSFLLAAIAALFVSSNTTIGGDKQVAAKLQFNVSVYEGDPFGSREAGTIKLRGQPRIVTRENQSGTFISGGELPVPVGNDGIDFVPIGVTGECKAAFAKDGKVRLDLTLSNTTPGDQTAERTQLHTQTTRTITTVKLGEVLKLRCGKADAEKQIWIELSVEKVKQ